MIEALSALPHDLFVVVQSPSGSGFDPVQKIEKLEVVECYEASVSTFDLLDDAFVFPGDPFPAATIFAGCRESYVSRKREEIEEETIELKNRELIRRNALLAFHDPDNRDQATQDLLNILRADRERPLGLAAELSIEDIRDLPKCIADDDGSIVRLDDILEPWATRFQVAMHGEGPGLYAYPTADWDRFLDLWEKDHRDFEQLAQKLDSL